MINLRFAIITLCASLLLSACSTEEKIDPKVRQQQGIENLAKGETFLKNNALQQGITVLPSGLQYKIIRAGQGKRPLPGSNVTVHYRGTSIDGREFDSSYGRGKPMIFQVNRVIPGWTEALQLMREGGKWQLFIPAEIAYGKRGAGSAIGPNETLIFDVELLIVH
ncbi:MAG: FKBP-type peptidyl-prolyl cis-trans isomerase [Mariprofundus sp.]